MRTPIGRTLPILAATLTLAFLSEDRAAASQKARAEKEDVAASRDADPGSTLPRDWDALIHLCREESRDLHKAAGALSARQTPRAREPHIQKISNMAREWRRHADALERAGRRERKSERTDEAESITRAIKRLARETGDALSNKDKMGNFDVQELMSRATQARNLASSIKKGLDKSNETIEGKVG